MLLILIFEQFSRRQNIKLSQERYCEKKKNPENLNTRQQATDSLRPRAYYTQRLVPIFVLPCVTGAIKHLEITVRFTHSPRSLGKREKQGKARKTQDTQRLWFFKFYLNVYGFEKEN